MAGVLPPYTQRVVSYVFHNLLDRSQYFRRIDSSNNFNAVNEKLRLLQDFNNHVPG
jgi:hypothetical protein